MLLRFGFRGSCSALETMVDVQGSSKAKVFLSSNRNCSDSELVVGVVCSECSCSANGPARKTSLSAAPLSGFSRASSSLIFSSKCQVWSQAKASMYLCSGYCRACRPMSSASANIKSHLPFAGTSVSIPFPDRGAAQPAA